MKERLNNNSESVTILIPCYNMEYKIHRLFDSILRQTRRSFKVIVIDDGSNDNSKSVIEGYIKLFDLEGLSLQYIYQSNAGAAGAINNGLKMVDTEYFCLPDADDFYSDTYIEECVSFLDHKPNCGIVFTQCRVFREQDLSRPVMFFKRGDGFQKKREEIFRDFYWDRNVWFCPQYMVRTSAFFKANNGMEIAGGKHGQNYQIILPVAYNTDFGYIDKPLYNYIIYKNSDSHRTRTLEQRIAHYDGGFNLLYDVFHRIGLEGDELKYRVMEISQKLAIQKANTALEYGNKDLFADYYNQINKNYLPIELDGIYKRRNWPFFFVIESYKRRLRKQLSATSFAYFIKSLFAK